MGGWKEFGLVLLVSVLLTVVAVVIIEEDVESVNATSTVNVIHVPESFGKTVSISVDSTRVVILFENGFYEGYHYKGTYKIVWEETQ